MDVRKLLDEINENSKETYFKVIEAAKEEFYDKCKTDFGIDSRNMILNATMGRSLRDFIGNITTLGGFIDNKLFIEMLEGLVEIFKESEKEMMEADNE